MTILKNIFIGIAVLGFFAAPSLALAATATIQNLSTASPLAKTSVTFNVQTSGYSSPLYLLTDSFTNTSITSSAINPGGNFYWVPNVGDIGTHNLSIRVRDNDGNDVTINQTITVLPPPSISIQSVSHPTSIMPGSTYSFMVSAPGFSNPTFSATDTFSGSTVTSTSVNAAGAFSWVPNVSQNGDHVITIFASDSAGHSAQATVTIRVGSGPTLTVPTNVSTTLSPGQQISFTVTPAGFLPTGFSAADSFTGSTISNSNINSSGAFMWTPAGSDAGTHVVTFIGQVGSYGQSASTSITINVLGPNGVLPTTNAPTNTTTGSTNVSTLQAQLAALQAQLGGASAATPSTQTTSSGFMFTSYLKSGSESDEVLQLQKLLSKLGYLTVAPNGYFGPSTLAAVKKFQAAHNLDQLGAVGPGTRAALNAALGNTPSLSNTISSSGGTRYIFEHFMGIGDDDPDVLELQKRLISLKFMTGEPTGFYGPATETAVKKFQVAHNLESTGYVAKITRIELNK